MRALPLPRNFLSAVRASFIATIVYRALCVSIFVSLFVSLWISMCAPVFAQEATQQESQPGAQMAAPSHPLITQSVDESQLTTLHGNTHPLARPQFDLGTASASLPMKRMLLVLKRSPDQEAALRKLLDDQQDKASTNYHHWLTPEQYGKQFGPTDADIQTITQWLQSHGFEVGSTKGRTVLEFSGTAAQVQEAFHTSIHSYLINGEQHWANATDPQIPTALTPAVGGVSSLNNFPKRAMNAPAGSFWRDKATGKIHAIKPEFTFPNGCVENNEEEDACYYGVGPYDFATIYNVTPLWNAGINGTGETIAIVGESNINIDDVTNFRSMFGLPANNPTIILNGPDPGLQGDEAEADIDVQWSGAVAPQATIDFVVSQSTETTAGVDLSAVYIIENNLAPVMSESYGECELGLGTTGNQFYSSLWQQAAAQGITVMISVGDNGAAGCDNFTAQSPTPAEYGLQVSGFASTPYNVAVGGTDFNDFSNPSTYWSTTNNSTTQASALSYIPETTWNDSCTNAIFATIGFSTNPETNCNNSQLTANFVVPEGGSGGVSQCTTPGSNTPASCSGGYAKPAWQSGSGVPADGKRDIPDLSLFASNGFVGSFYIICESDQTSGICNLNSDAFFLGYGGTSVSSPAFAGIMALVNQKTGSRQGNANYVLYKLAAQQPTAFHDVTVGTIAMPCATGSPNCVTSTAGDAYGVLSGYNTTTGYDRATGLGSVNANNLVTNWTSITVAPTQTTLNSLTPTTITHGQAVNFNVTVKPQTGTGVPTGTISFEGGPTNSTEGIAGFNLSSGTAAGSTELLPGGTYSLIAHYPGDSTYAASNSAPVSVTVSKENSTPQAFLVTFDSNGNIISRNTNTAVYASPYLLRVNVENSAGQLCAPVNTSGATGCPSGIVTLTDNGNSLDGGTFTLSSYGYFEDQSIQLTGGSHSVKAAYAGDESFNSSSLTNAITITPASTSMSQPNIYGAAVGQSAAMSTYVNTTSSGAAPSGTVTFYANGTALTGTTGYSPQGGGPGYSAYLQATLTSDTNAFTTSGNYAITASYSGDANYTSANAPAQNVTVKYPTPLVVATPNSQTVNYGGTASITVLVDTTNHSVYPTGTVTFNGTSAGAVACINVKDTSGNFACQATGMFTVNSGGSIQVQYSGDSNYPPSYSFAYISMPDFMFSASGWIQVTAGQSQNLTVTFSSLNGLSGTISNIGCSGLPAEMTCTFNPTQVTLPSNGTVTTSLTITTAALGQSRNRESIGMGTMNWGITGAGMLLGACFAGLPFSRRRAGRITLALMLLGLLVVLLSCGGGSSGSGGGGGGGGGGENPLPAITSLSPTTAAAGSQVQSLYVNGTNFLSTSTVTYNGVLHNSSLQSPTQIQIALAPNDVAATGSYPVVVTNPSPGGGSSAPVNFSVVTGTPTGYFTANMNATIGPITHSAQLSIQIQ